MYNHETLTKWGLTPQECDKEIRKIRIPNMRLTYDEKETLIWYIKEGYIEADDYDKLAEHIQFERDMQKEFEEEKKLIKQFIKEWRRLERKYDSYNHEDKSLDELVDMWIHDYFCLDFMDCHLESIKYYGAKEYAQVYLHLRGVIPEKEVTMWH